MTIRKEWLVDLVNEIPLDVADRDYLIERELPKLSTRGIKALLDACLLCARDGWEVNDDLPYHHPRRI